MDDVLGDLYRAMQGYTSIIEAYKEKDFLKTRSLMLNSDWITQIFTQTLEGLTEHPDPQTIEQVMCGYGDLYEAVSANLNANISQVPMLKYSAAAQQYISAAEHFRDMLIEQSVSKPCLAPYVDQARRIANITYAYMD